MKLMTTTCKLLETNIKLQGKMQKLLENNIKVQEKTHKLLDNNIKVQEKALQVQEKLFELLKELADTIRHPVIVKRPMPIIGPCGEREYIDCDFRVKQKHQPEISAQTKALGSQLNEMLASLELPMDATELFLKQGKLCNLGQQQVPKGQNKSIKNMPDAEQPQQQEIGNSELLQELPTMEEENEELSGPVRKRICLSIEANHEKEKQLQVHNAEGHPDLRSQDKLSVSVLVPSYPDVFVHLPNYELDQQPKLQKTERPREIKSLSVEGGIIAHVSGTNLIESSVDLLQEEQEIVPELTYQENLQEQEQEMQSFSHEKHQQAILSDVVKTPDFLLATGVEQEAENVIKEKAVELDLTASDQSCQTEPEQKQQHRQLGLPGKQPSESYCEGAEASKYQDEDHQAENVIKEKAVQSSYLSLELLASEQSCQGQLEKQEQQPERQLRPRGKKSAQSDCWVATAPEYQQEQQPKDPMQERMKLDHKQAEQRQLSPRWQKHSESESSLTTSMVELSPSKNQDTERQIEEKTRELKTSAEETGQRQLQQRQLQTRSKNLSESKHSSLSNTGMSQVDKPGAEDPSQLKRQPQVEKPGVGDPSQPKKKQDNRLKKRKWCTPEPRTMPNATGAIVTYQRRSGQTIETNPEAFQDLGPTLADHLEQKENHHSQRKKIKSKPTAMESLDELALTSQHLVVDPHILVKPPQLNPAAVGQLPQTIKEPPQKQQLLGHMKLRSCSQAALQSEPDVLIVGQLPQTTKELPQKQQLLRRMKLRSCSQAASQSESDVSMIDTLPAKHHSEQPQEQKHPRQPQKQRGRTPKPKLDRAGPVKHQKLQEQPKRRGRPPKLDVNTISGRKLISKNKQKQPKSPEKAKSRKVIKGKLQSQVRGKPQKETQGTPQSQVRGRLQKMSEGTVKSQVRERA